MSDNPFTLVYDELWKMLEAHPQFNADVKEGNRIKYNWPDDRDPLKKTVMPGDLPEVVLMQTTVNANLYQSSSGSMCTRQYSILISTGDWRVNAFLSQVEWDVFTALMLWKERLGALQWRSKTFVKRANIVGASSGASDPERNRNIKGWSAVWTVEVEMHFTSQDLLNVAKGD